MAWIDDNESWLARARARWFPISSESVTLRAWMQAPVVWDAYDGVTLEGALQHEVVVRETGSLPDDVFSDIERDTFADIPIPVCDIRVHGQPIACCSWATPGPGAVNGNRVMRKRARAELLPTPGGKGKITTGGGAFKSLQIPRPTCITNTLDFWCRGDVALLRDLLLDVGSIGRARAGGLGAVSGWEIMPAADWSLVRAGEPTRTLPVGPDGELPEMAPGSFDVREASTRAPYWHRRSRRLCVVPIMRMPR